MHGRTQLGWSLLHFCSISAPEPLMHLRTRGHELDERITNSRRREPTLAPWLRVARPPQQ
eukprot:COSAG01_NODE_1401_length_10450_cov_100.148198_17_plen_60_part_00